MDLDSEVERILQGSQDGERPEAPPSSYGSMKSDKEEEEDITEARSSPMTTELHTYATTGLQLIRSESPETLYSEVTHHQSTRQQGAYFTDRAKDSEEEDGDSLPLTDSPEPPHPLELEDQSQTEEPEAEDSQPGQLHPDLDLPYIFKSMQSSLSVLSDSELVLFKRYLCGHHPSTFDLTQLEESDQLDLVDKMLERFGKGYGLKVAIRMLECMNKPELAEELEKKCKRAVIQFELKGGLVRRHKTIYEGVPRPGQQQFLKNIYTEPQISTRGHGGVNPLHEIRTDLPSPPLIATPDSLIGGNNIFRLRSSDGTAVRCVLTTGLPGIGLSVAVQKFMLDWAEDRANQDIQLIFPFPFRELWILRERNLEPNKETNFMQLLLTYHTEVRTMDFLEKPDCKVLIILDGFDMYNTTLDFQNTPTVSDVHASVHLDSILVNLIRGSLLPGALVWITSRRGATVQIPAEFIHRVVEIQGYSDTLKDEYLTKHFQDKALAAQIVRHTKRSPTLYILCHMPFLCWMVVMMFEEGVCNSDYGADAPKVTSFYAHYLIIQINRRLEKYHGASHNNQKWTDTDRELVAKMGKLALRLLEKNRSVFYEDDLREHNLDLKEVVVFSGFCTELPREESYNRRSFCFVHFSVLEFMAALYTFLSFRLEGKIVLNQSLRIPKLFKERLLVDLYRSAIDRALSAPRGHYSLFLRFLCGLALDANDELLRGLLFPYNAPKLCGMEETIKFLQKRRDNATTETHENLSECLREIT